MEMETKTTTTTFVINSSEATARPPVQLLYPTTVQCGGQVNQTTIRKPSNRRLAVRPTNIIMHMHIHTPIGRV